MTPLFYTHRKIYSAISVVILGLQSKNIILWIYSCGLFKAWSFNSKVWAFRMSGENLLRHYSRWNFLSGSRGIFFQIWLNKVFCAIFVSNFGTYDFIFSSDFGKILQMDSGVLHSSLPSSNFGRSWKQNFLHWHILQCVQNTKIKPCFQIFPKPNVKKDIHLMNQNKNASSRVRSARLKSGLIWSGPVRAGPARSVMI